MSTVLWKPEPNALTTPTSYSVRYVPRDTVGYDELAAEVVQMLPNYAEEDAKNIIMAAMERMGVNLSNGNQIVLPNAFTFHLSFTARLAAPDDAPPPVEDMLNVRVHAARSLTKTVAQNVQLERLPMTEKAPLINTAEATVLGLNDVLNSDGALQLNGTNLLFDPKREDEGCVLEGTGSGRQKQSRFVSISNTEVILLPDIPAQNDPWNNEYLLSIATRYTENGTLRTSTYRRRLRTPLLVNNFVDPALNVGILTGSATAPYVSLTGGSLSADETVRIQVILNLHEGTLSFNLLDMEVDGQASTPVLVTADGTYTLPGFDGSAVSSLEISVNNYGALVDMIRNHYSGRLVDVLELKLG